MNTSLFPPPKTPRIMGNNRLLGDRPLSSVFQRGVFPSPMSIPPPIWGRGKLAVYPRLLLTYSKNRDGFIDTPRLLQCVYQKGGQDLGREVRKCSRQEGSVFVSSRACPGLLAGLGSLSGEL